MRTIAPVMIVFALAVSGAMLGGSGFADAWGGDPPQTSAAQDSLNDSASRVGPGSGPAAGPVSNTDSSLVGLIVSGWTSFVEIAGAVALLPVTLVNLGFPAWFAAPAGVFAQFVIGVGLVQFVSNREWR